MTLLSVWKGEVFNDVARVPLLQNVAYLSLTLQCMSNLCRNTSWVTLACPVQGNGKMTALVASIYLPCMEKGERGERERAPLSTRKLPSLSTIWIHIRILFD
jgi:hypothetical protein